MATSRTRSSIRLRVIRPGSAASQPAQPAMAWWVVALVGALGAALAGWLVVAGLVVLGWISAMQAGGLGEALRLGTAGWLLAHGVPVDFNDVHLSLTPLLLTAVLWALVHGAASFVARIGARAAGDVAPRTLLWRVVGLIAATYTLVVTVVAMSLGTPLQAGRALACAALLSSSASLVAAAPVVGRRLWDWWPAWARPIPTAVGRAVLVATAGGAVALVAGLVLRREQIAAIATSLHAPSLGSVLLVILQLLWAPTYVLWATAWALGGGVSLGAGSVVSLVNNHVGLLPGIPILGILPASGPASMQHLWWLSVGVLAGAVAGIEVVRRRPAARVDETALVGGLSGVLAAWALVVLCALSRGDLGVDRLVGLGPRLTELLVIASSLMGLSGLGAGLAWGLRRRARAVPVGDDDHPDGVDR